MRNLALAFGFVCILVGAPAGAADLKGHQATYTLTVSHPGIEADGHLLIAAFKSCKTWTVTQSSSLDLQAGGALALVMVQALQSEESVDGRSMKGETMTIVNGQRVDAKLRGTAGGLGKAGKVEVSQGGQKRTVELPEGAYFTLGATAKLIDELKAGKTRVSVQGFDAVTTAQVVTQNYEVLASPFSTAALPEEHDGLLDGKSWNLKSTFEVGGAPQTVLLTVHESGVTSRMLLTLDKIKVEYVLEEVTALPASPC